MGKIAGFAFIVGAGLLICLAASVAVAHSGALPYWIAVFLGTVATFFFISPLAIWFSSVFPVASDLSKTGSAGNAHPFPMVVATLCTVVFAFFRRSWRFLPRSSGLIHPWRRSC